MNFTDFSEQSVKIGVLSKFNTLIHHGEDDIEEEIPEDLNDEQPSHIDYSRVQVEVSISATEGFDKNMIFDVPEQLRKQEDDAIIA